MLAVNTNLRCLELTYNQDILFNELPNFDAVDNALSAVFSRNEGSEHQANETLTRLVLPPDLVTTIATILPSNQTIRELVLTEKIPHVELVAASRPTIQWGVLVRNDTINRFQASERIVILLRALEKNNTLRLLDLSGCSGVKEQQDLYDAILNCLETKPWLHLNLQGTPLSKSGSSFHTIQQKLQKNAEFREAFGNQNSRLVNSTGKTALRQSLLQSNALNHEGHVACMPLFSLSTSWAQDRNKCILFHRNQDEFTRGTEISLVKDSDIAVSIWDLAGQEEYHAFHDYMMPNFGDVVALHNSFIRDGILSADFKLNKGLITLNFQGTDDFVERSGDVGYYIDVLVPSSWNHDNIVEIIEKDIMRVIHETTHKCRGVWLVQSILRPQCVQELTLLKYRKDQVVGMEILKQELFMRGCDDAMKHSYTWRHMVEQGTNGQEIVVLETSYDPIIKLLGEKETIAFMECGNPNWK
ncbi:unnamed protein product [Sphagnum tenellum]